ncbi:MAG: hypothetical protein K0B16_18625 [Burkholderiaceae bacterium]|nr:hypothetical protein [Burkholderiaceae bacterium]
MSYILHLGHQPTDISGISGYLSTVTAGFDATLDVNALRFTGARNVYAPFRITHAPPTGDLWLGFRYVPPSGDAHNITEANATFLDFFNASNLLIARVRPLSSTNRYHAEAHGDTTEQGSSSYFATSGQPQWIDVRLAVGADITIEFFADGVLQSTATAANTGGKGKPVHLVFGNGGLHNNFANYAWYYAHIAILDGVSTIGRRFVRRVPNTVATYNEMIGSVDALKDGNLASRVASTIAGQRLSFSLSGPTGPAAVSAVAGVHLKQIAQAGTNGPQATAGFLRMEGVNHDATPVTVPSLAPVPVYSSWAVNPADATPWSDLTLPNEVGILSA